MRVNVCINGTFRYPDYVQHYAARDALGHFFFAHRRGRDAESLGLAAGQATNLWAKHYGLAAAFRVVPGGMAAPVADALCDAWQRAVIRRWVPCDTVEAVIGATADRVIAHAARAGARVLGHPVTTHPAAARELVDRARVHLGLPLESPRPSDHARRLAEIAACDALLADSHLVARTFRQAGVAAPIHVVHPSFNRRRFTPRAAHEKDRTTFLVVCVGIITPRKGQHVLLQAWRRLRLPDARLLLVGAPGRDARAVLAGHDGAFTHVPYLDHGHLRALLGRASCLVLPSAEDGFGQAALEAMACGVPTIVSDAAGASELVEHGHTGFVVPSGDVEALAATLARLHRDGDSADAMGAAAARAAHSLPDWPVYVARVLSLHARLLDRSPVREAAA
jgi:glycosyltransferase involved in cell wall biosynthesis